MLFHFFTLIWDFTLWSNNLRITCYNKNDLRATHPNTRKSIHFYSTVQAIKNLLRCYIHLHENAWKPGTHTPQVFVLFTPVPPQFPKQSWLNLSDTNPYFFFICSLSSSQISQRNLLLFVFPVFPLTHSPHSIKLRRRIKMILA